MSAEEAKELLIKYHGGLCTDTEQALVERWLFIFNHQSHGLSSERIAAIKDQIRRQLPQPVVTTKQDVVATKIWKTAYWKWVPVAATLFIAAAAGLYFSSKTSINSTSVEYTHDIRPGGNAATLKLSNGKVIPLSDQRSGVVIKAGQLTYNDGALIANQATTETAMSSITTPRGGQYTIELPDGSKVVLNAASTVKFPASFRGSAKRKVQLSGEAYFEIAKDKNHPFLVETEKQAIEVLGTHFNINAYQDEALIRTTLLEGSVKVSGKDIGAYLLKPGEQAINNGQQVSIKPVDIELAMDWKNGDFIFKEESLNSLMRRISRWYNVSINYTEGIDQDQTFTGKVSRSKNISEILKALSNAGHLKFNISGNTITIKK